MSDRGNTRRFCGTRGLFALILGLAIAAPVTAAELVAVRVGDHPAFTRVVFEFDVAGGYRIERSAEGEPANVIRVTLDAASNGRHVESRSPGIASVSVEAGNPRSVVRITAREPSWPIKEMILTNPPRVVLDFMRPEPAATPASAPKLAAAAPAEPVVVPPPIAPAHPPTAIATPPAPAIEPPTAIATPAPEVESPTSESAPEGSIAAGEAPSAEFADTTVGETSPLADEIVAEAVADSPASEDESEFDLAAKAVDPSGSSGTPMDRQDSPGSGESTTGIPGGTLGLVAAGLTVLLALAFVLVRRRRAVDNNIDISSLIPAGEAPDDRPIPQAGFSFEWRTKPIPTAGKELTAEKAATIPGSPGAAPGIFDDTLEEKEAMTMDNTDLGIGVADSEAQTQLGVDVSSGGAGGSNIVRIIQDMESRIAHLEARLDESVDARQQLERQVSAQTEELRVQRAAIARTQRALRSLNRADEEQATEPALRHPEKPPSSR